MNKQLRMAGLVIVLGLVLGLGYWQQPGSAAGQVENTLRRLISPATASKAFASAPRLSPAKLMNTITVTSLADGPEIPMNCPGPNCRLRDAIVAAADGDTIDFSVTGTIILNSYGLFIAKNLTISGPGAAQLTISGSNTIRVFNIGSGFTVALNDLTIANGYGGSDGGGGGIKNSGVLTLTNCKLLGNYTYSNGGPGGGISNYGTLTVTGSTLSGSSGGVGGGIYNVGTLTLINSTLSGNSAAGDGGGIHNPQGAVATIRNSTLSGNTAGRFGGGVNMYFGGVTLINSTLSGNSANEGGGVLNWGNDGSILYLFDCTLTGNSAGWRGGGAWNYGITYYRNTIIAGNMATGSGPDVEYQIGGFTSLGHNLVGIKSDVHVFPGTGDQQGTPDSPINPLLAPLANYGGPTQTHALLPGSPAIDAGDNCVLTNSCLNLTTDQRGAGFNRQVGSAVDIGAFESGGFMLAVSSGDNQSTNPSTDFANPLAVMVSANSLGEPVAGGRVTFTPSPSGASATIEGNPATIDSSGTATSGTVTANAIAGNYNVQAGGSGLNSVSFSLTNGIPCPTITVSPAAGSLAAGTVWTSYSQQFTQSGGAGVISWSVNPAIPGLSISSTGLLSGTPILADSYNFTVKATDINGCVGSTSYTLVIGKANQTITFNAIAAKTFGDPDFLISPTSSAGLTVSLVVTSGPCTLSLPTAPTNVHVNGAGSCTITASQSGDNNYNAASDVPQSFTIGKANQTITFGALANKTFGDAPFTVSATASSNLAVSFSATGNCTNSDSTVTITGAGSCTITAAQAGNVNYNPAPSVSQSFTIAKATATLTLGNLNQTYDGSPKSVTVTTSPANLSGVSVTYGGSATAPTNAGSYAVVASLNNANYQATNATGTLVVAKASQTINFGALSPKSYDNSPFTVNATASSGLPVSFTAAGACTVSSSTVTLTSAGNCTITASQAGNSNYNAAPDVPQSFTIAKANQTITFAALANKTYGDAPFTVSATASSTLPVSFLASGNCTVSVSTVTITGAGSCTITASQPGDSNYNAAPSAPQSFNIAKAAATLALSNLNQTYNASARSVTVTTSPANLSGVSVTYDGSATAPINAGSYTVVASLNNANYQATNATGTLVVAKASQTITFGTLANKTYGDAPFTVSATASSGLLVGFSATGNCTVSGSTITITGAGSCTITASQAGNSNFNAAPSVSQSFTIAKATATLTLSNLSQVYDGAPKSVTVTTNPVGLTGVNVIYNNSTTAPTNVGSYAVVVSLNNANYQAANVTGTLVIAKANQMITFGPLANKAYGDQPFSISATASSGLPVSFSATGDCTVSGNTVTITRVGSCTITASQAGNTNYNAAANVSQSFTIGKANQTITFESLANKTYGDPDFTVSATASSGLAVSFSATGSCTVTNSTVRLTGAGSCTITAAQAGNNNYNPAPSVSQSFTIAKATATLTLSNLNQTYDGSPKSVTVTTNPANLSGVSVTYSGSQTAPTNAGSYAVVASLNNANYQAANATGTLVIAKASQTINFGNLTNKTFGNSPFTVSATATSGLAVSFSATGNCTVSGNTVTLTGAGSCTITASQAGNNNYNAATPVTRSFTIAKANQTITFGPLPNKTFGDPPFTVSATASSGLLVSFTASGNCTISGNTVTLTGVGSCTITASQAGDANYNAAPSVSQSFNVVSNCPAITLSPTTLPAGTVGVSYTANFSISGGTPRYTVNVSGLPAGLSYRYTTDPSRPPLTISGTPSQAGNFTVRITVTDSAGCTNSNNSFPLTISKGTPVITWSNPADIVYPTPLSSTQLNATANVAGTFAYTPPAGTILSIGRHTLTVNFTPTDTANWNSTSKTVTINVLDPINPCPLIRLTPGSLPDGAFDTDYFVTLTASGGAGPYTFAISGLPSGLRFKLYTSYVEIFGRPTQTGTFSVRIDVRDRNGCTNAGSNIFPLTIAVVKGTPTITWNPANVACNTPLGSAQLNATANVAGTFVYTPPAGTILSAGLQTLSVVFTPNDTTNWNSASRSVTIRVGLPIFTLTQFPAPVLNNRTDRNYRTFTISDMVASVTDGCTSLSLDGVVIDRVTSDEPDNASGAADGDTINDIVIASDCKSVDLRMECDARGDGRVYRIRLRVTVAGQTQYAEYRVQVVPSQGDSAVAGTPVLVKLSNCQ